MTWDRSAFDQLRRRGGPQRLPLIAGMPDVLVDLSGLADLMLAGKLGQPLLAAVLALQTEMQAEREAGTAPDPQTNPDAFWTRHRQVLAQQDELIAAVWLDPPWCKMVDLPQDGTRPEGAVCIYDLSPEERRFAADLPWQGVDALESFRGRGRSPDVGGDGGNVSPEAEQLADSAGAPASPVLVRQSHMASVATPSPARGRPKSGQRHAS